jgi:hypothetical protein
VKYGSSDRLVERNMIAREDFTQKISIKGPAGHFGVNTWYGAARRRNGNG